MSANLLHSAASILRPFGLTGPIFTKELRVASRRRRNYVMRFAYLAILTLFVAVTWINVVESGTFGGAGAIYRMSAAGRSIVTTVCWFQFIAVQLTAVVLLSTSISEEIYHRTIGALLTTPITSLQIVMGKLASKMLLLVELMAVSVPLLAIVRVFGGVPWDYLLAATCITFTAGLFAACLSLFYSIFFRRAYSAVLMSLGTLFFLYILGPALAVLTFVWMFRFGTIEFARVGEWLAVHLNPIGAMVANESIASGMGSTSLFWPLHCAIMLGASLLLVAISVKSVRKAAIRAGVGGPSGGAEAFSVYAPGIVTADMPAAPPLPAATGGPPPLPGAAPPLPPVLSAPQLPPVVAALYPALAQRPIRPVGDFPLLWKELHSHRRRGKVLNLVVLFLVIIIVGWTYLALANLEALEGPYTHGVFGFLFVLYPTVTICVHAATRISSEKESRTLPILLTTPLSEGEIVRAKAVAVLRQSLPAWAPLGLHVLFFTMGGVLHPLVLLHVAILAGWVTLFLTASGLYFSSRAKKTTTAVVLNFGLALTLWCLIPMVNFLGGPGGDTPLASEVAQSGNPLEQAFVVVSGAADRAWRGEDKPYDWPGGAMNPVEATLTMMVVALIYAAVSLLFLWGASRKLRRNIF